MLQPGSQPASPNKGVFALRRFVYPQKERCEFCRGSLTAHHPHLIEAATRALHCVCPACARDSDGRFLPVPARKEKLDDFALSQAQWDTLGIPIDLAFLVRRGESGYTAHYPGPAGVIESTVDADAWSDLVRSNPRLVDLRPEVEALLVDRIQRRNQGWRLSIDHCFALAGIIRTHWRGLSGGSLVWDEIRSYLVALDAPQARGGHA